MRSDNNKPWGTHRTVEIPPAQLEPRDPRGVELLWKRKKRKKKKKKAHKIGRDSYTGRDTATAWHFHLLFVHGA